MSEGVKTGNGGQESDRRSDSILIRACEADDIPAIQAIYAEAVLTGTASFEIEPPSVAEMHARREALIGGGFPYLVACEPDALPGAPGTLLGYAYAGPYRPRRAYRFTVENSVYVTPSAQGRGVGSRLLEHLIKASEAMGARQMIAVIGDSANLASISLHRRCGFEHTGVFRSIGFKHGRWLDTVLMQRALGSGDASPP